MTPDENIVQVTFKYDDLGRVYEYNDPSGQAQVGDVVQVSTRNGVANVTVVGIGRRDWDGPLSDILV